MLANYLKVAIKVLLRRKFFTFISLFGISFTLVVLLILTSVTDHFLMPSAPEVHRDRTLHIDYMEMRGPGVQWSGSPGYGFLDRYARDLDGVETMAIRSQVGSVVSYLDGQRHEARRMRTDGMYWRALDFEFLEGGPYGEEDDAAGRAVAVIDRELRRLHFGDGPAVGETIVLSGRGYEIVGIVRDVGPLHMEASADVWVPIGSTLDPSYRRQLMGAFSAILVAESREAFGRIKADFKSRLPHVEFPEWEDFDRIEGEPWTRLEEMLERSNSDFIHVVALVLAFMLLPAINLVNINTSRILERCSEIGVRKAFGASAAHLATQFIVENVLLCLIGGVLAFVLAAAALEIVEGSGLVPHADLTVNVRVFLAGLGFATIFGVLSGAYPAWRMSRLHPVLALREGVS
jgi:putative ABC transport system permease protein